MGPHNSIGGTRQIQLWGPWGGEWRGLFGAPERGLSEATGGASNSLAPALKIIIVAFPIIERLTVLMMTQKFYFPA